MKIKKYFVIPLLAFLASSCQDEEQASIQPATGDEVRFGASLEQNATARTIYGPEANNAFPIYWVNGDKVLVYSPQCVPVTNAIYQVSAGENQNYATSLDKTGENGLQWGDSPTADFYSVYPAVNVGDQDPSGAEIRNGNSVVLTMPAQQDNGYVNNNGTLTVQPDMRACFMVANTLGVQSGSKVELQYTPLSTAVRFTLQGPTGNEPVGINYVRLYAPVGTNINGTFTADFSTVDSNGLPKLTATNGRRYVTFNVADEHGTYLTLRSGESIELNAFLLLEGETTITSDWYIEVGTTDGQSFIKYLDDSNTDVTLVPGKIHRLKGTLPPLTPKAWDPANWMTNIQRNVYLSEISIPGSWYSLNSDYQGARSYISVQYNAGVRAFHLDTRWRGTKRLLGGLDEVVDLGVLDTDDHSFRQYGLTGDRLLTTDAPSFVDVLTQITNLFEREDGTRKDDEYMVVICTFAQDSYDYNNAAWRQAISDACANNEWVIDANTLDENTVVQDVLGKVIVIVNTFNPVNFSTSKCLFFNMGMSLQESDWTNLSDPNKYYHVPLMYGSGTNTDIMMYGTHAQATLDGTSKFDYSRGTWVPSFDDRETMTQNILNWSKDNYTNNDSYAHNAWMYIGLGGYVPGDYSDSGDDEYTPVSDEFNPWFSNNVLNPMDEANSYYPVGIVLMNHATTYSSVVNDILQLNNKYRKAYDPNRSPVDGSYIDDNGSGVQSVAPGYSSGMKDNGTNAIGWTRVR